jgi:hypothetical protein
LKGLGAVGTLALRPRAIADAMVTIPKMHDDATSVAELCEFFSDDHVHAALIASGQRLVSVVERGDLIGAPPSLSAAPFGRLAGRTVNFDDDLGRVYFEMLRTSRRRLAVIGPSGDLVGLLCMKRSQSGFCSDQDVACRAAERIGP